MAPNQRVALIFPGQGAQFVGMGRDIYDAFPVARAVFELADEIAGFALSHLCFEGPYGELCQTINAQLAIVTLSLALLSVIQQSARPIAASFVAGHSLGEYSALVAAGTISTIAAITLVRRRGEIMQELSSRYPGAMSAVIGLEEQALEAVCQETGVFIANYNSPRQFVISGNADKIKVAGRAALEKGALKVLPLQVSGAFHSPLMAQAAQDFAAEVDRADWSNPFLPIIANTTASPLSNANAVRTELLAQITQPVKWQASIETMVNLGTTAFIEVGPGQTLTGLIRRINPAIVAANISSVATMEKYLAGELNV